MTKRIICILMLLIFVSQGCLAQGFIMDKNETENHIPLGGVLFKEGETILLEEEPISFFSTNLPPIDEYIVNAVLDEEMPELIMGLQDYGIHANEFFKIYIDIVMKHPEALLITGWKALYGVEGSDIVYGVEPMYYVSDKSEADRIRADMKKAVDEYVTLAKEYETDLEKLIVIHDKMVADCDYDVSVIGKPDEELVGSPVYHAYGALCNKKAVCQGYSQALYMIGKELGIEMDFCRSDEMKHMWNYVKLDGQWYHMDMTNDDFPDIDENGEVIPRKDTRAWHRYFLVSDAGLKEDAHGTDYGHITGQEIICDDRRYEADYLFNIREMFGNRIVFTAERAEDGYFHLPVEIKIPEKNIDTIVDFKNKSLYTGAVVAAPCVTNGIYTEKDQNGSETQKEATNIYLIKYATRKILENVPYMRWTNGNVEMFKPQDSTQAHISTISLLKPNVDESRLLPFDMFLWEKNTLIPYSMKYSWSYQ